MTKPRNYRHEYDSYQGTPEQIHNRALRIKAHRQMEKKVGKAALAGKDVDHKTPLRKGGSNSPKNWRVVSVKKNRGWEREPGY